MTDAWRRPPQDVPPDKLFRLLLRRPRPILPLAFRFEDAPISLFARALTAEERSLIRDTDDGERTPLFLSLSVLDCAGNLVFATSEEAGLLLDDEVDALGKQVLDAHHTIAPSYDRSDVKAWDDVLRKGALFSASLPFTEKIAACFEPNAVLKRALTPRPERYFGVPLADLTDGQRMAFMAAFNLSHKAK